MNAEMAWRREELKLDMLESLARSQRALSLMLEGAAASIRSDGASSSGSAEVLAHLETLIRYQAVLADRLTGLSPRQPAFSSPGIPWINDEYGVAGPFGIA